MMFPQSDHLPAPRHDPEMSNLVYKGGISHEEERVDKPDWSKPLVTANELMRLQVVNRELRAEIEKLRESAARLREVERERDELRVETQRLLAICAEWLPIVERQLASIPPAPQSRAWQTAVARVERLRDACKTLKEEGSNG